MSTTDKILIGLLIVLLSLILMSLCLYLWHQYCKRRPRIQIIVFVSGSQEDMISLAQELDAYIERTKGSLNVSRLESLEGSPYTIRYMVNEQSLVAFSLKLDSFQQAFSFEIRYGFSDSKHTYS